jgi:hypothetical protein
MWAAAVPKDRWQLFQVHLWLRDHKLAPAKGGKGPGLLQVLSQQQLDECSRAWKEVAATHTKVAPFSFQQQVVDAQQQLSGWQVPLKARGYTMVSIPWWEWEQLKGRQQQQQYLQRLLKGETWLLCFSSSGWCVLHVL